MCKRGELYSGNKLRTVRMFKQEFVTEPYVQVIRRRNIDLTTPNLLVDALLPRLRLRRADIEQTGIIYDVNYVNNVK